MAVGAGTPRLSIVAERPARSTSSLPPSRRAKTSAGLGRPGPAGWEDGCASTDDVVGRGLAGFDSTIHGSPPVSSESGVSGESNCTPRDTTAELASLSVSASPAGSRTMAATAFEPGASATEKAPSPPVRSAITSRR